MCVICSIGRENVAPAAIRAIDRLVENAQKYARMAEGSATTIARDSALAGLNRF
jgi:hypothetical protein